MNLKKTSIIVLALLAQTYITPVLAAEENTAQIEQQSVQVTVEIVTPEGRMVDTSLDVTECPILRESTTTTISAKCAIEQATTASLSWSTYGEDMFLDAIDSYATDSSQNLYWAFYYNQAYAEVALNQQLLQTGDVITLAYGVMPLMIDISSSAVATGSTSTIQVSELAFENYAPVWQPATGITYTVGEQEPQRDEDGTLEIYSDVPGTFSINIGKEGFFLFGDKPEVTFFESDSPTEVEAGVTNHVTIRYLTDVLVDEDVFTTSTYFVDTSGEEYTNTSTSALGVVMNALNIHGLDADIINSWTYYISRIGEHVASGFDGWVYTINQQEEYQGINDVIVNDQDTIQVFYSVWPYRVRVDKTEITLGQSIIFASEVYRDGDNIWEPVPSSSISIDGQIFETSLDGTVYYTPTVATSTIAYIYSGDETLPQNSPTVTVLVSASSPSETGGSNGGSGGGCGSCSSAGTVDTAIEHIMQYLDAHQQDNGSFGTSISYSDWAALAYSSISGHDSAKNRLSTFLISDPNPVDGPNTTTAYARRAMALMSLNINPYTGTNTNYIAKIIDTYDGEQFGVKGLINDDIFALIPLLNAGYTTSDPIVSSTIQYIIDHQGATGMFESPDVTGAALQVLSAVKSLNGVAQAITKALTYIQATQQSDGGFGNIYGTPWIMQGIDANGTTSDTYTKNGNTPTIYLLSQQGTDGSIGPRTNSESNKIWASTYAVPALTNKTWFDLLTSFEKPPVPAPSAGGGTSSTGDESIDITTSTPAMQVEETPLETEDVTMSAEPVPTEKTDIEYPLVIAPEAPSTPLEVKTSPKSVAGVKIAAKEEITKEIIEEHVEAETSHDDAQRPAVDAEETVHEASENPIFPYALGATILLALALGWRFIRSLV